MEQLTSAFKVELPKQQSSVEAAVPESYKSNSKKEKLLLSYADNFQRQFRQLYGDRKALFLKPVNEYGVEKFICTTLRPTYLSFKELYDYDGCASFVADYLNYSPLKVSNELPDSLASPTQVLKQQKGNSFDYSVLLCSLLIGVGYDAYCVCGYATQEITLLNQTRKVCPLLAQKEEAKEEQVEEEKNKYKVKPTRDLSSQFDKRQETKEIKRIEDEKQKRIEEDEAKIAEAEAPPPDKYHGVRFHCWVLVLSGMREVAQSFFMEPTTGETHPLDSQCYLGIESLWNHRNYWVNMQDCSQGVKDTSYDLGDATKWEFFFPNIEKPLLIVPGEEPRMEDEHKEEQEEELKEDFQLPPSWILPIEISPKEFENRCPSRSKTVLYYRAKMEKYSEYLNQDGLVSRLTEYRDTARSEKIQVKNYFKHRKDCLLRRVENLRTGQVEEGFGPGRTRALKEHAHYENNPIRAANRTMLFYSHARVDGLAKREISAVEMTEHFENREDFLYYRHVTYDKPTRKFEPSDKTAKKPTLPILRIVEKFNHNPAVPSNNDVAERTFLLSENRIKLVYHLAKDRFTSSTREFVTPPVNSEQAYTLVFESDMTSGYQVDPYAKDPKNRHLFEQLEGLLAAQEESMAKIRSSEQETQAILDARLIEELNTVLAISVYDVARNETARTHREELELKLAEEERIRKEKEMDYLAPFLARVGDPASLSRKQMEEVAEDCLKDLRTRLVDMANIIQSRFEKETEELQHKQAWYKAKQGSITKDEEAEYITYCHESMFRIHILEQRLNRHKTTAPTKYLDLDKRLKSDPRLAQLYFH